MGARQLDAFLMNVHQKKTYIIKDKSMPNSTTEIIALQQSINDLQNQIDAVGKGTDKMWILLTGSLVFFMQAGFCMLEAGTVRSKNTINILFKNLVDGALSAVAFWLVGYAFAFGNSQGGFVGRTKFGLSGDTFDLNDEVDWEYEHFFFQWAFAATASTIVSGSVAERCTLEAYFVYAIVITGWIYPVIVHWCWGDGWLSGFGENVDDYLFRGRDSNNYIDFAGSGVVHTVGGMSGLVAAIILGPRTVS
jgi:Amt family ammonium transporter